MRKIYFIIGASGAGKTTATQELEKSRADIKFFYPDKEFEVPSLEEMTEKYGSPSDWQKAKTVEWVAYVKEKYLKDSPVVIETQSRGEFIELACKENGIQDYEIILFDCNDKTRNDRLLERGQPELVNENMNNWAKFLREDSQKRGAKVIDTSNLSREEAVKVLSEMLA